MRYILLTSYNRSTGSGHFWRMTTLLDLLRQRGHEVYLVSDYFPPTFPAILKDSIRTNYDVRCDTLIRDCRDSTMELIQSLRSVASRIITIDDSGDGDRFSDVSVKLLPTPDENPFPHEKETFPFLYGYHFYTALRNCHTHIKKDIDLAIYSSQPASSFPLNLDDVISDLTHAFFNGNTIVFSDKHITAPSSSAELLLRSRSCLSHFGLTHFESLLCQCQTISLNPGPYHTKLADKSASLGIINCGEYNRPNIDLLTLSLRNNTIRHDISVNSILSKLNRHHDSFLSLIAE